MALKFLKSLGFFPRPDRKLLNAPEVYAELIRTIPPNAVAQGELMLQKPADDVVIFFEDKVERKV